MNRLSLIGWLTLVFILSGHASGETPSDKTKTIPLDKTWAYKMPGTRDILDLDIPPAERTGKGLWQTIYLSWARRAEKLKFKELARPGFVVSGSGKSALLAAHAIFVKGAATRNKFSPDEELTIVFFLEPIGGFQVEIRHVALKENEIEIQYELKPDIDKGFHVNLALIPLGKLPAGEYHVQMRQLPHELTPVEKKFGFKPLNEEWAHNLLCKPFRFAVVETRK